MLGGLRVARPARRIGIPIAAGLVVVVKPARDGGAFQQEAFDSRRLERTQHLGRHGVHSEVAGDDSGGQISLTGLRRRHEPMLAARKVGSAQGKVVLRWPEEWFPWIGVPPYPS